MDVNGEIGAPIMDPSGSAERSDAARFSLKECRAVIVFTGRTDVWWLRFLRSGFKHCYAVVEDRGQWVVYNPASHKTDIIVIGSYPMARLMDRLYGNKEVIVGMRVRNAPNRMAPIRPFSCVEAVKRLLGIRAPYAFTPWQLYKHLIRNT